MQPSLCEIRPQEAADVILIWHDNLIDLARQALRDCDRGTELLAKDAGSTLLALADHLLYVGRSGAAGMSAD